MQLTLVRSSTVLLNPCDIPRNAQTWMRQVKQRATSLMCLLIVAMIHVQSNAGQTVEASGIYLSMYHRVILIVALLISFPICCCFGLYHLLLLYVGVTPESRNILHLMLQTTGICGWVANISQISLFSFQEALYFPSTDAWSNGADRKWNNKIAIIGVVLFLIYRTQKFLASSPTFYIIQNKDSSQSSTPCLV